MFIPPEIEQYCIDLVNVHEGIIGKHLLLLMGSKFLNADSKRLRQVPAALALEGKIVEIEYLIPGRASQSLFLPKGTEVRSGKS